MGSFPAVMSQQALRIRELQTQLETCQLRNEKLQDRIRDLEAELEDLKATYADARIRILNLQAKHAAPDT